MNQRTLDMADAIETEDTAECPGCGAPLDGANNCWSCGYQQDEYVPIGETGLMDAFNKWAGVNE